MNFKITKHPTHDGGNTWSADPEHGIPGLVRGWVRPAQPPRRRRPDASISWGSRCEVSPDEARAFANAVIEIADAAEAEVKRLEWIASAHAEEGK